MKSLGCGLLLLAASSALAKDAPADDAPQDKIFKRFEVNVGIGGGGPLLFKDTPNSQLEPPKVFEYGPRLGFRFGAAGVDSHRFGVMFGFNSLARSVNRKLNAVDTQFVYAAGGLTELQVGAGARVALASEGFKNGAKIPYSGMLTSLELRHSFLDDEGTPVGLVAGIFAEATLGGPPEWSTAFVGARIDLTFRKSY